MSEIISKELDYNSEEDFLEDNEGILDYIYVLYFRKIILMYFFVCFHLFPPLPLPPSLTSIN